MIHDTVIQGEVLMKLLKQLIVLTIDEDLHFK